eukprot:scaffold8015_cov165-Ochromonas_danica.AAC.19
MIKEQSGGAQAETEKRREGIIRGEDYLRSTRYQLCETDRQERELAERESELLLFCSSSMTTSTH